MAQQADAATGPVPRRTDGARRRCSGAYAMMMMVPQPANVKHRRTTPTVPS
jgi:hypothetical protein